MQIYINASAKGHLDRCIGKIVKQTIQSVVFIQNFGCPILVLLLCYLYFTYLHVYRLPYARNLFRCKEKCHLSKFAAESSTSLAFSFAIDFAFVSEYMPFSFCACMMNFSPMKALSNDVLFGSLSVSINLDGRNTYRN